MRKLNAFGWIALIAIAGTITFFSVRQFAPGLLDTLAPGKQVTASNVPQAAADLPTGTGGTTGQQTQSGTFPQISSLDLQPGCSALPEVRWGLWFWNTHIGVIAANGGPKAAKGSAMCAHGVNLTLIREDDVGKQRDGLVAFATDYANGVEYPDKGFAFVSLMGDGTAAALTEWNAVLNRLGPEYGYTAEVVGSGGYSRGEDCLMGPPAWKEDPHQAAGGVCAAYLRDGDWNIGMKWIGDNKLCNNPDETTYDPDCVNWVAAETYLDAAKKYITGHSEDRPVVRNGKKTGERTRVTVNCVATWTPGDKNVADQKGGLVKIVSTKEYRYQMPMAIIGVKAWMAAHPKIVEGMLEAMLDTNEQLVRDDAAMRRAAALSAIVYHEDGADASYVYRYFFGQTERDKQGLSVDIGGSSVSNLADNCELFGIQSCAPGSRSIYRATYETFGNIVVEQYPTLVPSYLPYEQVVNTSYLERIALRKGTVALAKPDVQQFDAQKPMTQIVSRRSWEINFASNSATFSGGASEQLQQLLNDVMIAGELAVELHGHTDASGNPDANRLLSEQRAFAVQHWLEKKAPTHFPKGSNGTSQRIRVFSHGQDNPVAPNTTPEGKALNRRVEVILGMTL